MRIVLKGNGRRIVLRQTGARGQTGPQGPQGIPGQDGVGLPTGGTSGQVPVKQSSTDFDIAWETPPAAPVTSVNGQTGVVVLDAGDVGADTLGSAAQALSDANDYTDSAVAGVDTGVMTVVAGDNVTVDNSDPANPIVSAADAPEAPVTSVNGLTGDVVLNAVDIDADPAGSAAQALADANDYTDNEIAGVDTGVMNIVAGDNVTVDSTDPANPVVSADDAPAATWGSITGTLSDQTDLQSALDAKYDDSNPSGYISGVAWGDITGTLSDQTDLQAALDDKVDKVQTTSQLYAVDSSGQQTTFTYSNSNFNSFTVAMRDGSGRIYVNTAVNGSQAVNLNQLNAAVSGRLSLSGGTLTGLLSTNNDIEITDSTRGIILRSENGTRYRVTVADNGSLTTTVV